TTMRRVLKECYGKRSTAELEGPLPPLVHAVIEARPLEEALRELSDAARGYNVVIDGNLKEAKAPGTATFRNAPLDTAVEIVADMTGLTVVRKDNMLYATSTARAEARNQNPSQSKAREKPSPSEPAKPEDPPKKAPGNEKKQDTGTGAPDKPRSASPL